MDRNIWIEKTIVKGREDRIQGERSLGKALWSPQKGKPNKRTGKQADVYKNMRQAKKGDIVIHLINDKIFSGLSIIKDQAREVNGLPGTPWDDSSYLVQLEQYTQLDPPLDRKDVLSLNNKQELEKISKTSKVFYDKNLKLNQGAYLTSCSIELFNLLNATYKTKSGANLPFYNLIENITTEEPVNEFNPVLTSKYLHHYLSIKTKPFIILAGLSGTGKSRLVRTLAYQFNNIESDKSGNKNPPTNFQLIKVKPNWHDSSELLGYESRISGKDRFITTDFIRFIVKAWQYPTTPFFLCLDEMNLAPVEQYFAEYLSVIETRRLINGKIQTDPIICSTLINKYANKASNCVDPSYDLWAELELKDNTELKNSFLMNGLSLPSNLIVMGTVNMDETTHSFSRKVLDRAMTIEMNDINLSVGLEEDDNSWRYTEIPQQYQLVLSEKTQGTEVFTQLNSFGTEIINYLNLINNKLEGSPFKIAYRVRDEFLLYAFNYSLIENKPVDWVNKVLDEMTLMKILPRIEGEEERTKLLDELITIFQEKNLTKSYNKATEMVNRRTSYHYTSFWI